MRVTADVHLFEVKAKSFPYLLTALPKEKNKQTKPDNKIPANTQMLFLYINRSSPATQLEAFEWPKRAENVHEM